MENIHRVLIHKYLNNNQYSYINHESDSSLYVHFLGLKESDCWNMYF